MSASVSNYLFVMEERQRLRNNVINNDAEDGVGVPANSSVKRCLFGAPDPVELKRKLDEFHEEERQRGARKWGFDFETETPLENSRYKWERVSAGVPKTYSLPHLGSSSSHSPTQEAADPPVNLSVDESSSSSCPASTSQQPSSSSSTTTTSATQQQSLITDFMSRQKRRQPSMKRSESAEKRQCTPGVVTARQDP